jgi:hypothetical protein
MHDFRMPGVGEPISHCGEAFILIIVDCNTRVALLGGNFDRKDTRAEAFFIWVLRVKR